MPGVVSPALLARYPQETHWPPGQVGNMAIAGLGYTWHLAIAGLGYM